MSVDNDEGVIAQVKLVTYWADLPSTAIVGLFLHNWLTGDSLWFGIKNDGGTRKLGYVLLKDGVLGSFAALVNPSTDAAYYLRLTHNNAAGSFEFFWSTISFAAGSKVNVTSLIENVTYVGMSAMATTSSTAATLDATFDDFLARIPKGGRAFHWFAYCNPAFGGSPDMLAANDIIRTLKPAHTEACAIASRSLLCDNSGSGCDRGPMGAL